MLIKEMGILLDQELQKLNSFSNRIIEDDEKDIHLNNQIKAFVDNVVGQLKPNLEENFEENQRLLDSIHTIVEKDTKLDTFIYAKDVVFGILPYNYRHLVSDASEIVLLCGEDKVTEKVKRYLTLFSLLADNVPTEHIQLKRKGDLVFNSDAFNLPDGTLADIDSHFELHNLFEYATNGFYYENFNNETYPGKFVKIEKELDAYSVAINGAELTELSVKELEFSKYKDNADIEIVDNRLVSSKNLRTILNSAYHKTGGDSPVSNLANNRLFVYEDKSFYVSNIVITYIEEPVKVSHKLGINCNLPSNIHEHIVKQTAIHIKNLLADQTITFNNIEKQINN